MYTWVPNHTVDLLTLPEPRSKTTKTVVDDYQQFHVEVKARIEEMNKKSMLQADKYWRAKEFEEGEMVMIHLNKFTHPDGDLSILHSNKLGPFQILTKKKNINSNAYIIDLPCEIKITSTFNILHLYPYYP